MEVSALWPGAELQGGKYRIVRFISAGGFGCTYEAVHMVLETRVAIKEFFPSEYCNRDAAGDVSVGTLSRLELVEKLKGKFVKEARSTMHLNHKGIVRVHDVFLEHGTAYYVMDYIEGRSLAQIISEHGRLPEAEAVGIIRRVADALSYVHSHHMLHLDIKPANIMIDGRGEPVLIDFGVAKQYDEAGSGNTSTLLGRTPGYAPLEQMSDSVQTFQPCTDIYALGATLFKALTGETPVDALLVATGRPQTPLPPYVSDTTRRAVEAAMQTQCAARPQTVEGFLAILDGGCRPPETEKTAYAQPSVAINPQNQYGHKTSDVEDRVVTDNPSGRNPAGGDGRDEPKPGTRHGFLWLALLVAAIVAIVMWVVKDASSAGGDNANPQNSENSAVQRDPDEPADPEPQGEPVLKWNPGTHTLTYGDYSYKMVYVPGGTFRMGATSEQEGPREDEMPDHLVTLDGYYIGATEVPQWLAVAVMGSNPGEYTGDNLPVECVSWDDCQKFLSKLNSMTGANFKLPTEAQWEYAARGAGHKDEQYSGGNDIDAVAWYSGNSGSGTHEVGTKAPNALGLYDMSGNVWEWCSDWYGEDYYKESPRNNPQGPPTGTSRVLRGGGWVSYTGCRVAYRNYYTPNSFLSDLGFRLALQ